METQATQQVNNWPITGRKPPTYSTCSPLFFLSGGGVVLPPCRFPPRRRSPFSSAAPSAASKVPPRSARATFGILVEGGPASGEIRPSSALVGDGERETSGDFLFLDSDGALDDREVDELEDFDVEELEELLEWLLSLDEEDEELDDLDELDFSLGDFEPDLWREGDFSLSFFSSLLASSLAFLGSLDLRGSLDLAST